jgi:cell division protein FtsA
MAFGFQNPARKTVRPLAFLDIGSSKIACLIVEAPAQDEAAGVGAPLAARRLGFGLTRSSGIRAGAVVDLAQAEDAVRNAVAQAEQEAGLVITDVVAAISGGRLSSLNFSAGTRPATGVVASADIDKVLAGGADFAGRDGRELLHMHRLGFRLDGETGIRNPRGLQGERLTVDMNAVVADATFTRNLRSLLARSYLSVSQLVAAPYAGALACLAEDDLYGGLTVIDMGADTTTFALFAEGLFLHAGSIAVGGQQITLDIARALGMPLNQSERIKALYGNLVGALSDEHEYLPLARPNSDPEIAQLVTRAQLRRIIGPRIEGTLHLVRERIAATGLAQRAGGRVLLTGGASQLAGLSELVARQWACDVRLASPHGVEGFAGGELNAAHSVVAGMAYATLVPGALPRRSTPVDVTPAGYAGRLGRWFKDSFWDDEKTAESGAA